MLEVPMLMISEEDAEVFLPHPGHLVREKHQAWRAQDREARGQAAAVRARAGRPEVGQFQNH
ncbi:hypothetical protein ACP3WF_24135, partial [Salmonella enterica]|uniref:hypothetical protein n=1 Tax=Salmonella enterica TaxID=28901 RepID=UPI003CE89D9B